MYGVKQLVQLIHVAKGKTKICTCGRWVYDNPCPCGATTEVPMDDDAYRAFLEGITGKVSCTAMNIHELESVVDAFRRRGFPQKFGMREYMNDEKVRVVSSIESRAKSAFGESWEKRINGFLRKRCGKGALRFCSMPELRAVQGFINRVSRNETAAK